jgi:hypothetical protein
MRSDGSAANKGAATSCGAANTSMNESVHDGETFSAGDIIELCDDGGNFSKIVPPSSGSSGSPIVYQGASGDTATIDGGSANVHLIELNSDDYIEIKNLTLSNWQGHGTSLYCGIKVQDSVGVNIHNNTIYSDETGKALGIYILGASDNGRIEDNIIHTVFNGIRFDDKSTVVANNFIVARNVIYNVAQHTPGDADAIVFVDTAGTNDYTGVVIKYNDLYDYADHGIDTCGGTNIDIQYNRIHDPDYAAGGDGGGIKLNCSENESTINVIGNLIYNITGGTNPVGIMANGAIGSWMNNTIYNCGDWCINAGSFDGSGAKVISNNIMATCGAEGTYPCITYTDAETGLLQNNAVYNCDNDVTNEYADADAWNTGDDEASGNIGTDPGLTSDYRITSSSNTYDAGLLTINTDHHCSDGASIGWWDPDCQWSTGSAYMGTGTGYFRSKMP